jgi:hypothetical protein
LGVTFLPDVFTHVFLLHNLLRIEDEASIERLLHIIELEANTLHEDQPINIPQDETINKKLDGEERSKENLNYHLHKFCKNL